MKSILNIKGVQKLIKEEQQKIKGSLAIRACRNQAECLISQSVPCNPNPYCNK